MNIEGKEDDSMITENISFLIIDDIAMNRNMFKRRIVKGIAPNAAITEASTGENALDILKEHQFDFIIVDQHMEEAGCILLGTDTVVAMRRQKIASVVIGCSGNDIDEEFFEAGCDWVIRKPTPPNGEILKKIKSLMRVPNWNSMERFEKKSEQKPLASMDII